MKPKVAVYGAGSQGQTITADLTLAGYEVNLLGFPESRQAIKKIQDLGGIYLSGEETRSGKKGFAEPNMVTTDVKAALEDVDVVFACISAEDIEAKIKFISPSLKDGQILNFSLHGYWPCLRVADHFQHIGKEGVMLSETPTTIVLTRGSDGHVTAVKYRPIVPVAVLPSARNREVFDVLKSIFPAFKLAKNVLETGLASINLMTHPAITLLNIGWFDRAEQNKERIQYYYGGNTIHTAVLSDALEKERRTVCEAYNVSFVSLREALFGYYESRGESTYEVVHNCRTYQQIDHDPSIWRTELIADAPYLAVPLISLAEVAGVHTPLFKSFVEIMGAILNTDFWRTGLTLEAMGLGDLNVAELIRYVNEGTSRRSLQC